MKKLALALILLVALVGIGYLNSTRSEAKLKKQYAEGFERGNRESQQATQRADSLKVLMEQHAASYQDSLRALAQDYRTTADSLQQVIDQKDQEITGLKEKAKSARASKAASKPVAGQAGLKHAQILDYYRRRLGELPKDLSEYERKVALAEVRDETVKKFAITAGELDKIRQNGNMKD